MIFIEGFDYRTAIDIVKEKYPSFAYTKYRIVDNNNIRYDYISPLKTEKYNSNIISKYFYARQYSVDGKRHYLYFNINGFCLTDNDIALHVEKEVNYENAYIIYNTKNKIVCYKTNATNVYVGINLKEGYNNPIYIDLSVDKWFKFEDCEISLSSKVKEKLYNILNDLGIYYDKDLHKMCTLEKHILKDNWYATNETIFQSKEDYEYDIKRMASIPYNILFLRDYPKTIYYKSKTGLPPYKGVRKATENEIDFVQQKINDISKHD